MAGPPEKPPPCRYHPVAAAWRQGVGWRTSFATVEQEGALDLAAWLAELPHVTTFVSAGMAPLRRAVATARQPAWAIGFM